MDLVVVSFGQAHLGGRQHTETACRRGGALAIRPQDLDREQCLILLREKSETLRWQPVSPTLMTALVQHADERHAPPDGRLLRYRNGRQITDRPLRPPFCTAAAFSASTGWVVHSWLI